MLLRGQGRCSVMSNVGETSQNINSWGASRRADGEKRETRSVVVHGRRYMTVLRLFIEDDGGDEAVYARRVRPGNKSTKGSRWNRKQQNEADNGEQSEVEIRKVRRGRARRRAKGLGRCGCRLWRTIEWMQEERKRAGPSEFGETHASHTPNMFAFHVPTHGPSSKQWSNMPQP